MPRHLLILLACCALALTACSSDKDKEEKIEPVEILYNKARDEIAKHNFKEAVPLFEKVEQEYPYSEWAVRAEVMSGYASFEAEQYDDAILTLQRFAKMHPNSPS